MNEKTETPETLADALAAFRAMLDGDSWIDEVTALDEDGEPDDFAYRFVRENDVRDALNRIEAAYKRDRAIADAMLAVKDKPLPHPDPEHAPPLYPGNAAALRSALESIDNDCSVLDRKDMWEEEGECYYEALRDIREKVSAALAAPARNVDRFQTADEAVAAFADHLRAWENAHGINSEYPDHPVKVPVGAFAWLFAPAEGGAE